MRKTAAVSASPKRYVFVPAPDMKRCTSLIEFPAYKKEAASAWKTRSEDRTRPLVQAIETARVEEARYSLEAWIIQLIFLDDPEPVITAIVEKLKNSPTLGLFLRRVFEFAEAALPLD